METVKNGKIKFGDLKVSLWILGEYSGLLREIEGPLHPIGYTYDLLLLVNSRWGPGVAAIGPWKSI